MFLKSIAKDDWDGLLRPHDSPFLEHDWIYAMEESKCATMDSGGGYDFRQTRADTVD